MSINRPGRHRPGRPFHRAPYYPYPYGYPYQYPYPYAQPYPYTQPYPYGQPAEPYPYTQPVPTEPTPGTCPSGAAAYNVQSGDTLDNIASRLGVPVDAIIAINPTIDTSGPLTVGQPICLPTQ